MQRPYTTLVGRAVVLSECAVLARSGIRIFNLQPIDLICGSSLEVTDSDENEHHVR